jgi:hypothetical protein
MLAEFTHSEEILASYAVRWSRATLPHWPNVTAPSKPTSVMSNTWSPPI